MDAKTKSNKHLDQFSVDLHHRHSGASHMKVLKLSSHSLVRLRLRVHSCKKISLANEGVVGIWVVIWQQRLCTVRWQHLLSAKSRNAGLPSLWSIGSAKNLRLLPVRPTSMGWLQLHGANCFESFGCPPVSRIGVQEQPTADSGPYMTHRLKICSYGHFARVTVLKVEMLGRKK